MEIPIYQFEKVAVPKMEPLGGLEWRVFIVIEDVNEHCIGQTLPVAIDTKRHLFEWPNLQGLALPSAGIHFNHTFRFKMFLQPQLGGGGNDDVGRVFWFACDVPYTTLACGSQDLMLRNGPSIKARRNSGATVIERHGTIQKYFFDMRVSMEMQYDSKRRMYGGENQSSTSSFSTMALYTISSIVLHMDTAHFDFERVIALEQHKVVCVLKTMERNETTKQMMWNYTYAGRAQCIETDEGYEPRGRRYQWWWRQQHESSQPPRKESFPNLVARSSSFWDLQQTREQHADMALLRVFNGPLSARNTPPKVAGSLVYMPDNDLFSNTRSVLPLTLSPLQMVAIKFFNLKRDSAPQGVEITLRWADFNRDDDDNASPPPQIPCPPSPKAKTSSLERWLKPLRRSSSKREETQPPPPPHSPKKQTLSRSIDANITVRVEYDCNGDTIRLRQITLAVENYQQALAFCSENANSDIRIKSI